MFCHLVASLYHVTTQALEDAQDDTPQQNPGAYRTWLFVTLDHKAFRSSGHVSIARSELDRGVDMRLRTMKPFAPPIDGHFTGPGNLR